MTCKGICHRYKALKPPHSRSRYVKGQKRCNSCDIYIEWNGLFCPCCGYRLRASPRHKKWEEKDIRVEKGIKFPTVGSCSKPAEWVFVRPS